MLRRSALSCLLSACLLLLAVGASATADVVWTQVGSKITEGISGAAPRPSGGWVIVRDNKGSGQNRVALLGTDGVITPLTWPGTNPQDLESIDAVPGVSDRYVAVTSAGLVSLITLSGTTVSVVRTFTLPSGRSQNEGFALTTSGATTLAVWGNGGSSTKPGRLFTSTLDPATGVFGRVMSATVSVPYPTTSVRHISDVELIGERIVISSTSDPGNNGPFASALYDVGRISLVAGRSRLALISPTSLGTFAGHKIEAIDCDGGTGLLGTDDELQGAYTAPAPFCG